MCLQTAEAMRKKAVQDTSKSDWPAGASQQIVLPHAAVPKGTLDVELTFKVARDREHMHMERRARTA